MFAVFLQRKLDCESTITEADGFRKNWSYPPLLTHAPALRPLDERVPRSPDGGLPRVLPSADRLLECQDQRINPIFSFKGHDEEFVRIVRRHLGHPRRWQSQPARRWGYLRPEGVPRRAPEGVSHVLLPLDSQGGSRGDLDLQVQRPTRECGIACFRQEKLEPVLGRTGPLAEHLSSPIPRIQIC